MVFASGVELFGSTFRILPNLPRSFPHSIVWLTFYVLPISYIGSNFPRVFPFSAYFSPSVSHNIGSILPCVVQVSMFSPSFHD